MTSEGRLAQKGPACYIRSLIPALPSLMRLWALRWALSFISTDRRIGLPPTLGPGS